MVSINNVGGKRCGLSALPAAIVLYDLWAARLRQKFRCAFPPLGRVSMNQPVSIDGARSPAVRERFILASASPRRRELMAKAGLVFEVIESGIDEIRLSGEPAHDFALRMAREKAQAVTARHPRAIVLGADTVVEIDGYALGKPSLRADARWMIRMLSGRTHNVITGYALMRGSHLLESRAATSMVRFRTLSAGEIESYVATNEPYDKAGGYAVQGRGRELIAQIEGSIANVMGLPIEEIAAALERIARGGEGRR